VEMQKIKSQIWNPDILSYIFKFLEENDLCRCSLVCCLWRQILQKNDLIWEGLYRYKFLWGYEYQKSFLSTREGRSWRKSFITKLITEKQWKKTIEGSVSSFNELADDSRVGAVQFNPTENKIIIGSTDATIRVCDLETKEVLGSLRGHDHAIYCLQYIGNTLISSSHDSTIKVWSLDNMKLQTSFKDHKGPISNVRFFTDTSKIASVSDDFTCKIFDLEKAICLQTLNGHSHEIYGLSLDGHVMCTGSQDCTTKLWDSRNNLCVKTFRFSDKACRYVQLQDNTLVACCHNGGIAICDIRVDRALHQWIAHEGFVNSLQFDDTKIVSVGGDGVIKVWNINTCKLWKQYPVRKIMVRVQFDDSLLVCCGDGPVCIWDHSSAALNYHSIANR